MRGGLAVTTNLTRAGDQLASAAAHSIDTLFAAARDGAAIITPR